jgi:hypothetical protein
MKFRKLRIAWSVVWGLLAVLLIALWVRSYSWSDDLIIRLSGPSKCIVHSMKGTVSGYCVSYPGPDENWTIRSESVAEMTAALPPNLSFDGMRQFQLFNSSYSIPHWLPVMLLAMVTAGPWLYWRFSLRILLMGMTLVAVILGVIAAVLRWPAG